MLPCLNSHSCCTVVELVFEKLLWLSGDEDSGLWSSIKSTFSSAGGEGGEERDEGLNIFCLATGHLYERLLKANTPKKTY